MYNYLLELTYKDIDSDEVYRNELLDVFGLSEYNDEVNKNIDNLYTEHAEFFKDVIISIRKHNRLSMVRELDENTAFMFLFSWEYFYETHEVLKAINSNHDTLIKKQILLDKILSDKK
jgi:hypothetical protein|tara:strand:- start:417 stop:770 length:354 start_codon:yes stop_codon:yes gene_type:complete